MHDDSPPREDAGSGEAGPGRVAAALLHVIDACMRRLQRLRDRIQPPPAEDARRGHGHRAEAAPESAAPPPRSLLRRALTVVLAVTLGAGAASFMAYRGFAQLIASQEALIEFQQEEIEAAHKQEAINVKARAKAQSEAADLRKRLREVQVEVEERDARIDQLDQQVIGLSRRLSRPAFTGASATRGSNAPNKTGSCVTGTTDAAGHVLDCIDKFNRP